MKRKSLIALGVASALGAATAVYAGTPYPASVNEAQPWTSHETRQSTMITPNHFGGSENIGSTSASAGGTVSGGSTFDHSFSQSLSGEQFSSLTMDESLSLANEGIYSEYHTVAVQEWDYYALTPMYDMTSESIVYMPSYLGTEYTFHEVDSAM